MKKESAWNRALKEEYRCGTCGMKFNFEHLLDKHVYEKHPERFFRKCYKGN